MAYVNFIKAFRPISCPHHPLFFLLTYSGCLLKLHTSFPLMMMMLIALNSYFLIVEYSNSIYSLTFFNKCAFFNNARKMTDLKASEKKKQGLRKNSGIHTHKD